MARRYRAFISYSWADKAWAGWLHRTLETYHPPKALIGMDTPLGPVPDRLHPIFKDREEEAAGHGISASIEAAMGDAEFLIVVCSPRSVRSKWVNKEIAWFKTHRAKERVLALVIDGEPGASLAEGVRPEESPTECFPEALLYEVDDQLQVTTVDEDLPLAADARKEGDGKRLARLKLAAALLGLGLDTLLKRDERRRAARLRWTAIGMGSIAVTMSTLALVAVQQRDLAREMQSAAEVQRNQAEGLVEFMIGDLRHKLEGDVQLEVLDDIATRAQDYYVVQSSVRMDDDALGRRARVLDLLGDLKQDFGDSETALELLQESVEASAELLRRDPDNPQRLIEQAHSIQGLGSLTFQRGDIEEAERLMRQAVELTARLRQLDPDNPEWLNEQGSALVNLGVMRLNNAALEEAAASFREAAAIKRASLITAHDFVAARYDLSLTLAWLARARLQGGDVEGAHVAWQEEASVLAEILDAEPGNNPVLRRRAVNRLNQAESLRYEEDFRQALELAASAVEDAESFMEADGSDTRGIETAARAHLMLADILMDQGVLASARESSERTAALVERLVGIDDHRYYWTGPLLGASRVLAATVGARTASNVEACRAALNAITDEAERLQALAEHHEDDTELAAVSGRALMLMGDAAALAGDDTAATRQWDLARRRARASQIELHALPPANQRVLRDLERREGPTAITTLICGPIADQITAASIQQE
jgi:tetratricopeptide (TPR) repeat protein